MKAFLLILFLWLNNLTGFICEICENSVLQLNYCPKIPDVIFSDNIETRKKKKFAEYIKESILENNFKSVIENFNNSEEIETHELRKVIAQYSKIINDSDYRFNNFETEIACATDKEKNYFYGYRWATEKNVTVVTIEINVITVKENNQVGEIIFISHLSGIPSISFPNGNIDDSRIPPAIPPPPPPGK